MPVNEQVGHLITNTKQLWGKQSKAKKIIFVIILFLIIFTAIALSIFLNKDDGYVELYSNLSDSDYSEIVTELNLSDIPMKTIAGNTIEIPSELENQVRMDLAIKGYPKEPLTDSFFDNVDMFSTNTQIREAAIKSTRDRLQAMINTLEGIDTCYVTLDVPEKTNNVITTQKTEPTASVIVHLKPEVKLSSKQISGIYNIVSSAVDGLNNENISIVDGTGTPLLYLTEDELNGLNNAEEQVELLNFKQQFEDTIKDEISSLLVGAYGYDGFKCSVYADLDFDKNITQSEEYTPQEDGNGVVYEQDIYNAEGEGVAFSPYNGVVGVEPNADGTYPVGTGNEGTPTSWSESDSSTSYFVDTLKTQTEKAGYYVRQVTVSVVLYSNKNVDIIQINEVQSLAANAAGTPLDSVKVGVLPKYGEIIPENPDDNDDDLTDPTADDLLELSTMQLILFAVLLLVLLIIFIIILIILKRKKKKRLAEEQRLLEEQQQQLFMEEQELLKNIPETKEVKIRKEIDGFVESSPEIAAMLLKSWIREDEE